MYSLEKKQNVNSGLTVKHIGQECETIRLHNTINFESGNLIDYRLPPVADVSTSIEEKKDNLRLGILETMAASS